MISAAPAVGAATASASAEATTAPSLPERRRAPRKKAEQAERGDPAARLRDLVVARLEDMKARDLRLIDVRGRTSITDHLVIASGTSSRHVRSMAEEVVVAAKGADNAPLGVEGEREGEWVLVDLGDVVVHLMLPRVREFYGLERMWGVDVPMAPDSATGVPPSA